MRKLAILILLLAAICTFAEVDSLNMRMLDVYVSDLVYTSPLREIEYDSGYLFWCTGEGVKIFHISIDGVIEYDTTWNLPIATKIFFFDSLAIMTVINNPEDRFGGYILINIADPTRPESLYSYIYEEEIRSIKNTLKVNDSLFYDGNILWNIKNPYEPEVVLTGEYDYIDEQYRYRLWTGYEEDEYHEWSWGILQVDDYTDGELDWVDLYTGPRGEDYNQFTDIAIIDSFVYLCGVGYGFTSLKINESRTSAELLDILYEPDYSDDIYLAYDKIITNINHGTYIFDPSNPEDIEISGFYSITDSNFVSTLSVMCDSFIVSSVWWRDTVFVGEVGLLLLKFEDMDNINEQGSLYKPEQFNLETFPNPFNSSIHITGAVEACYAVYDIYGNMVSNITNGYTQSTAWQPTKEVASGVYIIKASTRNGATSTKPVIYVK